jgi:glutaredoxin
MNITVYSKTECGYCTRAKILLEQKQLPFRELQLGRDFNRDELLAAVPNAKTFPVIVIDGEFIGGYDRLGPWLQAHNI